ncbi:molybdenum cofactor guanylyltransferase [Isoptericola sp. NPDC019693]|uniref:molybdenum cofactor guanylyltransferase n=1 Tax=Isoptericola sp. NPDC019693 TaxID=3364009 RepID=UPI0037ADEAAF
MGPAPAPTPPDRHDAVVLAGGRATRLGGVPKPTVVLDGVTLLDRALAATRDAARTVVVGPDTALPPGHDVLVAREDPPFGGPVAGIDAGLRALDRAAAGEAPSWVLVLAVDVPRAGDAVPLLRAAVTGPGGGADAPADVPADGAYLVRDGHAQWLVGLYRRDALRRALDALSGAAGPAGLAGAPVRRLVARLSCVEVADREAMSDDVDTWDDLRRLTVGLDEQRHEGRHQGRHTVVADRATTAPASPHRPHRPGGHR